LRSVVKVLCVSDAPDYEQPWQSNGPTNSFGSGSIIDTPQGLRVLTNAHCVSNNVFVEVRRYGKSRKYVADVEALGHECDLALLKIDDASFFNNIHPIPMGDLPGLRDRVSVCGYPIGGERLSITEGIVSRIDLVSYAQANRALLAVQIDAAINAGNSGGPVIKDGELVGVAFQALDDAEQIGYMVSPPVVRHFLQDVASGRYDGFPSLGVAIQVLESEGHRRYLQLPPNADGGVLVTRVAFGGSAWGVLEAGDVLLEVEGAKVARDGTVRFRKGERLHYDVVVAQRHVGDRIKLRIWRRGQPLTCVLDLRPPTQLVAEERYDVRPTYYVYGGLLFVPLTRDYLKTWGEHWWQNAPRELVALYESGIPTADRQEPVVLQKVLADRVNQGYHELENLRVTRVNDTAPRSMRHLMELVDDASDPYLRIETSDGSRIVLERDKVSERAEQILRKYNVPHQRSSDLR
jgi:S1-C subfamily serine protease